MKLRAAVVASAVAVLLSGCGLGVSIPPLSSIVTTSLPSNVSVASHPSTGGRGEASTLTGLPDDVVDRIVNSGMLFRVEDVKHLVSATDGHVYVVGNVPATLAESVRQAADQSLAADLALEHREMPKDPMLILLADDAATAKDWGLDTSRLLGVSYPPEAKRSGFVTISAFTTFDDGRPEISTPLGARRIVQHELFHATTIASSDGYEVAPKWVTEGFAEWAARTAAPTVPAASSKPVVPADAMFVSDGSHAYDQSALFVTYLVNRFGQPAAFRFYDAIVKLGHDPLATLFARAFGVSLTQATATWGGQFTTQVAQESADARSHSEFLRAGS